MPKPTTKQPNSGITQEVIESITNRVTDAVSKVLQPQVAKKIKDILGSNHTPQKKTKMLMVLIGELENGVMEYE